jgi:hypothetical protein
MRPSIQLASGKFFNFSSYTSADIEITDIAHALSNLCRFTGHCREFYSVAQHSVLVSRNVPEEFALEGLLHDATEAYVNDMARPLKLQLRAYIKIEDALWPVVAQHYGLPEKLPPCIKEADNRALVTERRDIMPKPRGHKDEWDWAKDIRPWKETIYPEDPRTARTKFLQRYRYLVKKRVARDAAGFYVGY